MNTRRIQAANNLEIACQRVQEVVDIYSMSTPNEYNQKRRVKLCKLAFKIAQMLNEERNLARCASKDLEVDKHYAKGKYWRSNCTCVE